MLSLAPILSRTRSSFEPFDSILTKIKILGPSRAIELRFEVENEWLLDDTQQLYV